MKLFSTIAALVVALGLYGCGGERVGDRATSGAVDAEHQTAGLNGELTNGKVDETMEGSGNLAWQGSYEREKRAKAKAQP